MILNILKAFFAALLGVLSVGITLLIIGGVIFAFIFGAAAIWIVRVVLIVLIAKFLWEKILS